MGIPSPSKGIITTLCTPSDLELDLCTLLMEVLPQRCTPIDFPPRAPRTSSAVRTSLVTLQYRPSSTSVLHRESQSVNSESFSSCRRTLKPEGRGSSASLHYLHRGQCLHTCAPRLSGRRHLHRIVRHGWRNSLLGGSAHSQPASLPCASVSLLQLLQQDRDSSARRAPRQPPNTVGGAAPSYNPQGIERSHRRKLDLKPVLLDIDQLIDSAAPSRPIGHFGHFGEDMAHMIPHQFTCARLP